MTDASSTIPCNDIARALADYAVVVAHADNGQMIVLGSCSDDEHALGSPRKACSFWVADEVTAKTSIRGQAVLGSEIAAVMSRQIPWLRRCATDFPGSSYSPGECEAMIAILDETEATISRIDPWALYVLVRDGYEVDFLGGSEETRSAALMTLRDRALADHQIPVLDAA